MEENQKNPNVQSLFARISPHYELCNRLLSYGMDIHWRKILVREVMKNRPGSVLDLATGTGDVALQLMQAGTKVTGVDFCPEMLAVAKQKGVTDLITADILNLPLPDSSFDAVTIAFGFRNLEDRPAGLKEMKRILRSDGWLHILEFSQPVPVLRPLYFFYLQRLLPVLTLPTRNHKAYAYLASSIRDFPSQKRLCGILEEAGFQKVAFRNLTFGAVALHSGQKPIS